MLDLRQFKRLNHFGDWQPVADREFPISRRVWLLLNYVPHWLWLLDRSDSPWYPSMRLFRQRAWGDWAGVFDEAAAALLTLAGRRSSPGPTASI